MERSSSKVYGGWTDGWDGWMVIIGRRYSKSTFGANNYCQLLLTVSWGTWKVTQKQREALKLRGAFPHLKSRLLKTDLWYFQFWICWIKYWSLLGSDWQLRNWGGWLIDFVSLGNGIFEWRGTVQYITRGQRTVHYRRRKSAVHNKEQNLNTN